MPVLDSATTNAGVGGSSDSSEGGSLPASGSSARRVDESAIVVVGVAGEMVGWSGRWEEKELYIETNALSISAGYSHNPLYNNKLVSTAAIGQDPQDCVKINGIYVLCANYINKWRGINIQITNDQFSGSFSRSVSSTSGQVAYDATSVHASPAQSKRCEHSLDSAPHPASNMSPQPHNPSKQHTSKQQTHSPPDSQS